MHRPNGPTVHLCSGEQLARWCPCGKREKLLERAVMATAPSLDQQVVVDAMAPSSVSR